jgi:hypothetical protein
MDCGADIVAEAGQRQLGRTRTAADLTRSLNDVNRESGARQLDRGCQPIRSRADDDGGGHRLSLRAGGVGRA